VLARQLNAGQMVAFYGYAAFLMSPIRRMTYAVSRVMQAHVAAGNVTRLLRLEPDIAPALGSAAIPDPGMPADPASGLADPASGLVVPASALTAVVCAAGDASAIADRLGRYTDSAAAYDGQPLTALPLDEVRRRVLVTPGDAHLFAGPLRRELDPADKLGGSDDLLWAAVDAAAARDIIEALPEQLETPMAAAGREFSGGQQQRLRLARALMADPEVLILIDPASAVDAHTEAAMATGIARSRQGRATVVFTTSALLLNQADRVALVLDGTLAAEGSHQALMEDSRYRSLVERGATVA
jgi:ABC-type multidrug transport system fused ATPase/permease subunit